MNQLRLLLSALIILLGFQSANAQCTIRPSATRGCVPQPILFQLQSGGKSIDSILWTFGDGQTSDEKSPNHVYKSRGQFNVNVKVKFSDGTECNTDLTTLVKIYDNPSAVFNLQDEYYRCFEDPEIEFSQASVKGKDNSDIVQYIWDLGDGDTSERVNPKHVYEENGQYLVKLEVTDGNGCKDTVTKKILVNVLEPVEVTLSNQFGGDCPITPLTIGNTTDSLDKMITRLRWEMDNGDVFESKKGDDDWDSLWKEASTVYEGSKVFYPKLTVWNRLGCMYESDLGEVENIFFKFEATISPNELCFGDLENPPIVRFSTPVLEGASYRWVFGDPSSPSPWSDDRVTTYVYEQPGTYKVSLRISIDDCDRDTQFCDIVTVFGPQAKINGNPTELNTRRKDYSFYPNSFPDYFDTCLNDSFVYFTLDTQRVTRTRYKYCNTTERLDSMAFQLVAACPEDYSRYFYELKPTDSFTYQDDRVTRAKQVWKKGQRLPTGGVYSNFIGNYEPSNIHDTDIYAPTCGTPHTVFFKNNSIKYRGYEAFDNFPGTFPDSCRNPSYPWASDSMDYFWDFGEGSKDTSTELNVKLTSRYSTERVPTHTYLKDGCYEAKLTVYDPETGCSSSDVIAIVAQKPHAGWDTVAFDTVKRMDYALQQELVGEGRRGLIVDGLLCQGYRQRAFVNELLPRCRMDQYWVVFDSALQTTTSICGADTFLYHDWTESPKDPELDAALPYYYETTGWKTVGIVVKLGDCFDTMWYHNYKYIYKSEPDFDISGVHFCPGDSVAMNFVDTTQEGVMYAFYDYTYLGGVDWLGSDEGSDTLNYVQYKGMDATSSLHNSESGVVDDSVFNKMSQTVHKVLEKPGVYTITGNILHRFDCGYSYEREVFVGHYANFKPQYSQVCTKDSFFIFDTIRYYGKGGLDDTPYWVNPEFYHGAKVPSHYERVEWDFDDDGKIDHVGSTPKWAYEKPGAYTITMYTKDSFDCEWQVFRIEDAVKVVSLEADFKVANDDSIRFCAPQVVVFEDLSKVDDGGSNASARIRFWIWSWGDGDDDAVRSRLENNRVGHLYNHNGTYTVTLQARLSTYDTTEGEGCLAKVTRQLVIEGPKPKFKLVGDSVGCVPFLTTVEDESDDVSVWEWRLGHDGRTKPSFGDQRVNLTYPEPGTFCISLYGGDDIIDEKGDTLYCVDYYPYEKCAIKVRVLPKDTLDIVHDTLLCLGESTEFDLSKSHEDYEKFRLALNRDTLDLDKPTYSRRFDNREFIDVFYTGVGPECPDTAYSSLDVIGILADFNVDSSRMDTPVFWFDNLSEEGVSFDWTFEGNVMTVDDQEPIRYEYQSAGEKEICLVAYNAKGCSDTICKWLEIEIDVWVPNVLTPNGDGFNDHFKIPIKGQTMYDLTIYNRWGEKVFESDNFNYRWNGQVFNTLGECPMGTYYYIFNYQLIGQDAKQRHGSITLLRD